MRVFSVVLLVMGGTVFAGGPAGLIVTLLKNGGVTGMLTRSEMWLWIILANYFIATFISGGLVTMLPLLLNLCATMMFIPALKPSGNGLFIHSGAYIMGNLFCEHPLIYVLIYVLQFFIYGGSFALVSLAVSFFIDKTFLVIISPFVTYYGLGIISTLCKSVMNINSFNPMALLSPATKLQDGMLFAYICEPIIICVICGIIFFMKGKNNEAL